MEDVAMRTVDLSPLYRSFVGFDRIADLLDAATKVDTTLSYPPYDIEKSGEDAYRISLAVAGFKPGELDVVSQPNMLVVTGRRSGEQGERQYLHHGIAARPFEQRFNLADHIVVKDARYEDGVLTIDLAREVPEALKPRRIEIGSGLPQQRIEAPQGGDAARAEQTTADSGRQNTREKKAA
jgi:molecular chaperone IbpA